MTDKKIIDLEQAMDMEDMARELAIKAIQVAQEYGDAGVIAQTLAILSVSYRVQSMQRELKSFNNTVKHIKFHG